MPDSPLDISLPVDPSLRTQGEPDEIPARLTGESDTRLYSKEDLEEARKQEKDKLYRRLETMQETVRRLESEAEKRTRIEEEAAEARRKVAEQAQREEQKREEEDMSAKELLALREKEFNDRLAEVQAQVDAERALREQESRFAELVEVRQQILQAYSDRVAPELLDLIQGNTPEELQQSAEDLAVRTERILAQTAEAMQNAKQQAPTARITAPASGENSASHRMYTPEEIRAMSVSEYAKHRASLLGGNGGSRNRGLFG